MIGSARALKYVEVGKTAFLQHIAYVLDLTWRTIFLVIIVYIFAQLWKAVYAGNGGAAIEGFDLGRMMWYLMIAEVLVLSTPQVWQKVGEEVRSGDLAYRLSKPYSYILYHYAGFMAEAGIRFIINLAVGSGLVLLLLGPIPFSPGQMALFLLGVVGAFTVHYCLLMMIGLSAFWVEEPAPYYLIYQKILFILGGMLLPIELFPGVLRRMADLLPLRVMIHGPAKLFSMYDPMGAVRLLVSQILWGAALVSVLLFLYRRGVKRVHVNGG